MRVIDKPQPGLFKMRLVRGGPWVAARIFYEPATDPLTGEALDRSYYWRATIDGRLIKEPSTDPFEADVDRVWIYGRPIDQAEFDHLSGVSTWAKEHSPTSPEAEPGKAVNLLTVPIPSF